MQARLWARLWGPNSRKEERRNCYIWRSLHGSILREAPRRTLLREDAIFLP